MRQAARRWVVLVVAVAASAGASYWVLTLERQSLAATQRAGQAAAHARALESSVGKARRAVAAMASPGQAAMSWSRQATGAIVAARRDLLALAGSAPEAASLTASTDILDQLVEAERRVRDYAVGGKTLMASDVAFGEALPLLDTVQERTAAVMARVAESTDTQAAAFRDRELIGIGSALAALLCAGLLLVRTPARVPASGLADPPGSGPSSLFHDDAREAQPQALYADGASGVSVDMEALASVCGALATLTDGAELPEAVGRIAHAMGATGVVIWMADRDRRSLTAVASSGYDAKVVARFGEVPFDDATPTSRAFVSGAALTTPARAGSPEAIAVPIVGPHGAIGVLSAELSTPMRHATASARIAAAQLATLLAPSPSRTEDARAEG